MKILEGLKKYQVPFTDGYLGNENLRKYVIDNGEEYYEVVSSIIWSWQHVSVQIINNKTGEKRLPTYGEMEYIRNLFFRLDEMVIEFFPRREDYVNDSDTTLHLWVNNAGKVVIPNVEKMALKEQKVFLVPTMDNLYLKTTCSWTDEWQIVSIEIVDGYYLKQQMYPNWDELCLVKDMYFNPNSSAYLIHNNAINRDNYKLYLWRNRNEEVCLPNPRLVGEGRKYKKFYR